MAMQKYLLIFILCFGVLSGKDDKTICLNMIVKDEKDVIERCLTSVLPIIDYWVIVDTGSCDGTQEIIRNFMAKHNVKGELFERPWINFGHNRNEALDLAKDKGDYVFFIDADEYLEYDPDFKLPKLDKDYYYVNISCYGTSLGKVQLVNNHKDWKWVGVLHEVIALSNSRTGGALEKVSNIYTTEGARSKDPLKYQKDAEILEAGLKAEPNNERYLFYLGQSYKNAGNPVPAILNYEKRIEKGGWPEEVFYSMLDIARLQQQLQEPKEKVIKSYTRAFTYRPTRVEPLYYLANYYRQNEDFDLAYQVSKLSETIPPSQDALFVERWVEDYGLPIEISVSAYWTGRCKECKEICEKLLKKDLPTDIRELVKANLEYAEGKIRGQMLEEITSHLGEN
jgi:glycosyltransferase involved in cell wall biosynthesis